MIAEKSTWLALRKGHWTTVDWMNASFLNLIESSRPRFNQRTLEKGLRTTLAGGVIHA